MAVNQKKWDFNFNSVFMAPFFRDFIFFPFAQKLIIFGQGSLLQYYR